MSMRSYEQQVPTPLGTLVVSRRQHILPGGAPGWDLGAVQGRWLHVSLVRRQHKGSVARSTLGGAWPGWLAKRKPTLPYPTY